MPVATLRPNGAGDQTEFRALGDHPNWKCVDDVTPDDMTTCSNSTYDSERDDYALEDLGLGAVTINSCEHNMRAYQNTTRTITPYWRLSGSEQNGTERAPGQVWTSYAEVIGRPGGGGWSYSEIDSLLIGTLSGTGSSFVRCTQAFADIDYTAGVGGVTYHASAALAGAGTLAALAGAIRRGASDLAGAGSLTALAGAIRRGASSLAGAGTLAALGGAIRRGASDLVGAATLGATAGAIRRGAAAMAGACTMVAIAVRDYVKALFTIDVPVTASFSIDAKTKAEVTVDAKTVADLDSEVSP